MRRMLLAAGIGAVMALPLAAHAQETASARMMNAEGEEIGTVTLTATASGLVHVIAEVADLPPGPHGFHIHQTGQCDPAGGFESAGGHYAGDKEHGVMVEGGPHPGDFPNVNVGQDGVLKTEFFTDRVSLGEGGENPLMDEDGSAMMIHSGPDDYASQPSGDAGDRIACGVIE